jgi:hypothetical protein
MPERVAMQWIVFFAIGAAVFGALWAVRMWHPAKSIDPAKPGFFLSIARKLRTASWSVGAYRFAAQKAAPFGFLVLAALAVLSLGHRAAFDLLSAGGAYCTADMKDPGEEKLDSPKMFATKSICHATGVWLVEGGTYRIRIDMDEGADGEWFDKDRRNVAGFAADSVRHVMALPLKRWWWENWFQPVARIREVGNYVVGNPRDYSGHYSQYSRRLAGHPGCPSRYSVACHERIQADVPRL